LSQARQGHWRVGQQRVYDAKLLPDRIAAEHGGMLVDFKSPTELAAVRSAVSNVQIVRMLCFRGVGEYEMFFMPGCNCRS